MKRTSDKQFIENMLDLAGITINGSQPWDIKVHNDALYSRIIKQGTLGLGEAYVEKWWDCENIDMLFYRVLKAKLDTKVSLPFSALLINALAKVINFQTKTRAKQVAHQHYDLSSDLFNVMLDKNKIYSCGYFKKANTLEEAQLAKLELSCKKLELKPGMRVLDIGCGWGGLAKFAAEKFDVEVVGVTISQEQYNWVKNNGEDSRVNVRLQDYRDIHEKFDRIVSIGMFEHVGPLNYEIYMNKVNELLEDKGLFLLHTIGANKTAPLIDPWVRQYIFPNAVLPSISQIASAAPSYFIMEDWQNFGAYYDKTLMFWHKNFITHWYVLQSQFDERFYRMWVYYLLSCAGSFRARSLQLWQIVFSKGGVEGGYMAPR